MIYTSFILVPLIAGYAFADSWHGARFRIARSSGYALYFSAALYGAALLTMGGLVLLWLVGNEAGFISYINQVAGFFRFSTSPTATEVHLIALLILTLFMGLFGGHLLNFIPKSERFFLRRAIENSDFERLVLRAIERSLPMLVTLDNGKVYVGFVIRTIDPLAVEKELRILPVFSGFRSKDTGVVEFHTNYSSVLRQLAQNEIKQDEGEDESLPLSHLNIGDFEVVIPVAKIVTSTLYDSEAKTMFSESNSAYGYKFAV